MNALANKQVSDTLELLHQKASADSIERRKAKESATFERSWDTAYMAVNPEEGYFLNFLATVAASKNIGEFGCSFGISTIYLAAAARDNGGRVTTTDIEPNKVSGARKNLEEAGLADFVTILQGDAMQTLASVEGPIDFLFLDGAKELYLPVFDLMRPKLSQGAIIFADNADRPDTQPFVEYILSLKDEFTVAHIFEKRAFIAYLK
jgi:predicted O-methyltransferase YrrM